MVLSSCVPLKLGQFNVHLSICNSPANTTSRSLINITPLESENSNAFRRMPFQPKSSVFELISFFFVLSKTQPPVLKVI